MRIAIAAVLALGTLQAQNNLTTAAQRYFNSVRRSLESSADVMPADGKPGGNQAGETRDGRDRPIKLDHQMIAARKLRDGLVRPSWLLNCQSGISGQ